MYPCAIMYPVEPLRCCSSISWSLWDRWVWRCNLSRWHKKPGFLRSPGTSWCRPGPTGKTIWARNHFGMAKKWSNMKNEPWKILENPSFISPSPYSSVISEAMCDYQFWYADWKLPPSKNPTSDLWWETLASGGKDHWLLVGSIGIIPLAGM